jgi:hypothetical protein
LRNAVASILSVVAAAFFLLTAAGSFGEQSFGFTTVPASNACALVVTSAAGQSGLHAGDTIDATRLTAHERLRLMVPRASDSMMLPAHRMASGGAMAMVMVAPAQAATRDAAYVRLAILLVLMLLGLYVLWRGRDAASLGLGVFFAMIPAFFLSHAYAGLPDWAVIATLFLATLLNLLGYLGLYVMVDALAGSALPAMPRNAVRLGAVGALTIAGTILFSGTYGRVFTGCPPLASVQVVLGCYAVVIGLCFLLLWRGIAVLKDGSERARLRWVFWSTVVGFAGPLAGFAFVSLGRSLPLGGALNLSFLAIPLGYTYAVLRHRVIDVGFVLNRALSLTILTSAIVVLFIVVESLIERLAVGHAESMLLQLAFSVGLGMTFNRAHGWLEPRLERLLFRSLYELEESLRKLGERADSYDDEEALLHDIAMTLDSALSLLGCGVYREFNGRFWLAVSVGGAEFPAEAEPEAFSYALRARGRVLAGIVLIEDPSAEALASEEADLLRRLTVRLSASLAALRAERYEREIMKGTI